jgi:diguanylate cyclase (GGDEF)-like protein
VLGIKTQPTDEQARSGASFEPYGRLLKMLLPSLRGMVVHDGFSNLVWASDDWPVSDELHLVTDAIRNALSDSGEYPAIMQALNDDLTDYSFVVRGDTAEILGVVSLAVALSGMQTAPRAVAYIRQLVQPVLECMGRELGLRSQLGSRERDLGVRERDLTLMLEMSSQRVAADSDADEFDLLLKTGLDHMGCALAALWVPEKNISLSMTRSGQPMAPAVLERAEQHLMTWMKLQQRTIIINRIAKVTSDAAAPYKILACPIRHTSERVIGVLALFNPPSAEDFDLHQTRIAELLAKRAMTVIQSHYDPSTGLMTRHAFERQAKVLMSSDVPTDVHSILYLDIDRLHVINETFGMHVGDDVIVSVAECMAKALPGAALSARISGDRLAALIPNATLEQATAIAEKVCAAAAAIVPRAGQGSYDVSVSIGVAPILGSDNSLAHALATAEIACKAAKDRGRNRVETFQDSDQSIIRRHTDILGHRPAAQRADRRQLSTRCAAHIAAAGQLRAPAFRAAAAHGRRPRRNHSAGQVHVGGRPLSADADRRPLGRAPRLRAAGHEHRAAVAEDHTRFAINLSGQSLQDDTFLDFVVDQIKTSGIAPSVLCFELTETATIGNLTNAQAFMRACRISVASSRSTISAPA